MCTLDDDVQYITEGGGGGGGSEWGLPLKRVLNAHLKGNSFMHSVLELIAAFNLISTPYT